MLHSMLLQVEAVCQRLKNERVPLDEIINKTPRAVKPQSLRKLREFKNKFSPGERTDLIH